MATNNPSDDLVSPYHSWPKISLCPGVTRQRRDVRAVENTTSSGVEGDEGAAALLLVYPHYEPLRRFVTLQQCVLHHFAVCHGPGASGATEKSTTEVATTRWLRQWRKRVLSLGVMVLCNSPTCIQFSKCERNPWVFKTIHLYSVLFDLFSRPLLLMKQVTPISVILRSRDFDEVIK